MGASIRLTGFHVIRRVHAVTDAMVDAFVLELRDSLATLEPTPDAPCTRDRVVVHLAGDGAEEDHAFDIGAQLAIPALESLLACMHAGETRAEELTWPDGSTKHVQVELREVRRITLPPMDDAFARRTGRGRSVATMLSAVRRHLEREAMTRATAAARIELLDAIAAANNLAVPTALYEAELARLREELGYGEDVERGPIEELHGAVLVRGIMRRLVVDAVAAQGLVRVTAQEVRQHVLRFARANKREPFAYLRELRAAKQLPQVRATMVRERASEWLLTHNRIQTVHEDAPV